MSIDNKAVSLAKYIGTLTDFRFVEPEIPYSHMGATITDAMLQPGIIYDTVVKPRVEKIRADYPEAKTTTGFLKVLDKNDPKKLLNWRDSEKPSRILEVSKFFAQEGIETEVQLRTWLEKEENIAKLDEVRGVGMKTIEYFRFLSGADTSAIDRHLLNFLKIAGIGVSGYVEAKGVIDRTADLIGKNRSLLDHSIWKYMSEKKLRGDSVKERACCNGLNRKRDWQYKIV
jgi:hypothetical protein